MRKQKQKILILAAELTPIAKVGGLGDVIGALPKALSKENSEIRIFLPFYGFINKAKYGIKNTGESVSFNFDNTKQTISIWKTKLPGTTVAVFLIKHKFFSGKSIYDSGRISLGKNYTRSVGDVLRFNFFSQAALEVAKRIDWRPDIVHCHDWHVAVVPGYLKGCYKNDEFFARTKTLLTIHNLANQGIAPLKEVGFSDFPTPQISVENKINFLAQGIINTDLLNTVSQTYATEILAAKQGAGLNRLLVKRKKCLSGVLNGIDTEVFNPKTDRNIKYRYDLASLEQKDKNKQFLQKMLGLPVDGKRALVGVVSRLVNQKGLDLITDKFAKLDCQFVFLGTGQKDIEEKLQALNKKYPEKFSVQIKFDVKLAQKIYAGADIFLMPSLYEPCGLGQLIAMRYGTIPVVRATGGLADTVDESVGFSFESHKSNVLYKTLEQALDVYYKNPGKWQKLQKNAMIRDYSWNKPAQEYKKIYLKLAKLK